nr:protein arginine n-methyltransferase sfm1 [Quercus suber]
MLCLRQKFAVGTSICLNIACNIKSLDREISIFPPFSQKPSISYLTVSGENMDHPTKQHTFIVEHLDPELEAWQKLEYNTINQECSQSNSRFFLTGLANPSVLCEDDALNIPSSHLLAESVETLYAHPDKKRRVCLLDPKGEKDICPADGQDFDVFLFGDRTAELRKLGFTGRRLGPEQMTTDTAARVTRIVVQEGKTLDQIPFVYKPEIPSSTDGASNETVEMPFKYVLDASSKPIMPKVGGDPVSIHFR